MGEVAAAVAARCSRMRAAAAAQARRRWRRRCHTYIEARQSVLNVSCWSRQWVIEAP